MNVKLVMKFKQRHDPYITQTQIKIIYHMWGNQIQLFFHYNIFIDLNFEKCLIIIFNATQ